jgi:hypothetical protein
MVPVLDSGNSLISFVAKFSSGFVYGSVLDCVKYIELLGAKFYGGFIELYYSLVVDGSIKVGEHESSIFSLNELLLTS